MYKDQIMTYEQKIYTNKNIMVPFFRTTKLKI